MKPTPVFILLIVARNKIDHANFKTELLTSGSWIISAVKSDNSNNGTYEKDNDAHCITFRKGFIHHRASNIIS